MLADGCGTSAAARQESLIHGDHRYTLPSGERRSFDATTSTPSRRSDDRPHHLVIPISAGGRRRSSVESATTTPTRRPISPAAPNSMVRVAPVPREWGSGGSGGPQRSGVAALTRLLSVASVTAKAGSSVTICSARGRPRCASSGRTSRTPRHAGSSPSRSTRAGRSTRTGSWSSLACPWSSLGCRSIRRAHRATVTKDRGAPESASLVHWGHRPRPNHRPNTRIGSDTVAWFGSRESSPRMSMSFRSHRTQAPCHHGPPSRLTNQPTLLGPKFRSWVVKPRRRRDQRRVAGGRRC